MLYLTGCANTNKSFQTTNLYANRKMLTLQETSELPFGARLRIRFKKGTAKYGTFQGIEKMGVIEYQERYKDNQKLVKKKIKLPTINESVTLKFFDQPECYAEFLGFDYKTINVRMLDKKSPVAIRTSQIISMVDTDGYEIESDVLDILSRIGDIPYETILLIQENNKKEYTPIGLEQIAHIQYIGKDSFSFRENILQISFFILATIGLTILAVQQY